MKFIIYTDGACEGNQFKKNFGGWAAIIIDENAQKPMKILTGNAKNTTNNKMELLACIKGLEFLNSKHKFDTKTDSIELFTDSGYITNCFKARWFVKWRKNNWTSSKGTPVKNKELWEKLLELYENFLPKISLHHVKGHSGIKYNEMADQYAVNALRELKGF